MDYWCAEWPHLMEVATPDRQRADEPRAPSIAARACGPQQGPARRDRLLPSSRWSSWPTASGHGGGRSCSSWPTAGLRPGEAIALRRRHLDDLGRLTIEGAVTEHKGKLIEGDTKTHRSRLVQVPASVLRGLREYMAANVASDQDAPIFSTPTGTRVRLSNWRHKVWQPAIKKSGLPGNVTPYVLRHTAASLMAQQGVPVSTTAASLGHDPAIYLRTYAHLYPAISARRRTPWTLPALLLRRLAGPSRVGHPRRRALPPGLSTSMSGELSSPGTPLTLWLR